MCLGLCPRQGVPECKLRFWGHQESEIKASVTQSVQLLATLRTVAHQAPLSMGFSRIGHWSGLPFPSPGESSQPRDRTRVSRTAGGFFTSCATREHKQNRRPCKFSVLCIGGSKPFCSLTKGASNQDISHQTQK